MGSRIEALGGRNGNGDIRLRFRRDGGAEPWVRERCGDHDRRQDRRGGVPRLHDDLGERVAFRGVADAATLMAAAPRRSKRASVARVTGPSIWCPASS